MERKECTKQLDPSLVEWLTELLNHEGCLEDYGDDEVIEQISVDFEDGVEVDIDVCNGGRDDNSSPYVNVNWYKEGMMVHYDVLDTLLGEYEFIDEETNVHYIVTLK